ncbi:hypothetical protein PFISCL1PPCAC_18155, partial [Pristionchus fissidentatus]
LLLASLPQLSLAQFRCRDASWSLIGPYCYYIVDPENIKTDFTDQQLYCRALGGYLPCIESKKDQQRLVDWVADRRGGQEFDPFYIGLQCNVFGYEEWVWVEPLIPYNQEIASFDDDFYDPLRCGAPEVSQERFLMTLKATWKALSSYPDNFTPQLAVCQKLAIPDTSLTSTSPAPPAVDQPPPDDTLLIIALVAVVVILILIIVLIMIRFRNRIKELMTTVTNRVPGTDNSPKGPPTEIQDQHGDWEINRQFVNIHYSNKLGSGAFGVVYLGTIDTANLPASANRSILQISSLKLSNGVVAVKTLHEYYDRVTGIDFQQEIEIMQHIGYHDRLVNLIACVTESVPNLLIAEYCSNGDLLSFLKERRKFMLEHPNYANVDPSSIITQAQQLRFSVQIANGLEFLSSRGYIHRDIAARNILVDDNYSCKIGDFGMCRKIQDQEELYLSRGGRLPIKWMSPEALRRYEMSTASDVWSYGVLLFEIITLGGSPYPSWEPTEILPRLEAGERMGRPDNCPDHVYDAMTDCWNHFPGLRPDFTTLRSRLAAALEQTPSEYYLQLDAQRDYYLVPRSKDFPISEEQIFRMV